jgi:hypothetical protein
MSISRDNYESFLIDFLEGTLPKSDHAKLFDFLEHHADLKEEFALLNKPISKNELPFENKLPDFNFLKKSCEDWVADEELIALMEHDLIGELKEIVEKKLANYPSNNKRYELFLQTKLIPEEHVFPNKIGLKKKDTIVVPLHARWAVAASLLVFAFIGIWSPWNQNVAPLAEVSDDAYISVDKLILPSKEITQKGFPVRISKPVVARNTKLEIQQLKLEENAQSIAPMAIKSLPIVSVKLSKPSFESAGLMMAIITESPEISNKFLTPGNFVLQQIKKEINKRYIGFSFHEEVDPESQVIRYGFISKYFAYERIIQTN